MCIEETNPGVTNSTGRNLCGDLVLPSLPAHAVNERKTRRFTQIISFNHNRGGDFVEIIYNILVWQAQATKHVFI